MGKHETNQNNVGRPDGYATVIPAARTVRSDGRARDEPRAGSELRKALVALTWPSSSPTGHMCGAPSPRGAARDAAAEEVVAGSYTWIRQRSLKHARRSSSMRLSRTVSYSNSGVSVTMDTPLNNKYTVVFASCISRLVNQGNVRMTLVSIDRDNASYWC
jgi:hypothetical protein